MKMFSKMYLTSFLMLSFLPTIQVNAQETLTQNEEDVSANKKVVEKYSLMGRYEGARLNVKTKEPLAEKVSFRFVKSDISLPGFRFLFNAESKPREGENKSADHFNFELNLQPLTYTQLFQSDEEIKNLNVGPDKEMKENDVFEMNKISALTDKKTGIRTIVILTESGDRGDVLRKYTTTLALQNNNVVKVDHVKIRYTWGFFDIPLGFRETARFESGPLTKLENGLELIDYGRITKPGLIESAAIDSTPKNFERLIELEKIVDKKQEEVK